MRDEPGSTTDDAGSRPSMTQLADLGRSVRIGALVLFDTLTYAAAVGTVVLIVALVVGIATGGGLVRVKVILFFVGFGLMAYATVRLWPRTPGQLADDLQAHRRGGRARPGSDARDTTRFQRAIRRLPPARWVPPPPQRRRLRPATRLFVGSVLVLAISYVMEAGFGVQ